MDRQGATLAPRSKRVLAHGRRIASRLGATLYAVAVEADDDDAWIGDAGLAGADKIVLLSFSGGEQPICAPSPERLHGALRAVCDALEPNLVLLDRDGIGPALADGVAEHLGSDAMHGAVVHEEADAGVLLVEHSPERALVRSVSLGLEEAPVVATLSTLGGPLERGRDDADVIFFKAPEGGATLGKVASRAGEHHSEDVVILGVDCSEERRRALRELGSVLGAQVVLVPPNSDGSQALAAIAEPRILLTVGVAQAIEYAPALDMASAIVTLDADPRSAALRCADWAVLGPVSRALADLTCALREAPRTVQEAMRSPRGTHLAAPRSTPQPSPHAVELFSDAHALLAHLHDSGLWTTS